MITVPDKPVIVSNKTTATTISISWSVPSGSAVEHYEVEWFSHQCPDGQVETVTRNSSNFAVSNLWPETNYTISVSAINSVGRSTSDNQILQTLAMGKIHPVKFVYLCYGDSISIANPVVPSVPSAAPSSVSVTDVTVFTITVQWGKVPCNRRNGLITNYTVWYNWDTENGSSMAENNGMTGNNNTESRSVCVIRL